MNPAVEERGRIARAGGASIAYRRRSGKSPTVVFLGGFMSDMSGSKASALDAFCAVRGQAFLRFDYSGHGESEGSFVDGTIGVWLDDALLAIDRQSTGPLVLVGSSMGGWIALHVALARRERILALVGIAAAPDFTEDLIWGEYDAAKRAALLRDGVVQEASEYASTPTPITRALIEDGRRRLLLRAPIAFDGPVRLLHGQRDPDVPWRRSLLLADRLTSSDVRVVLVKDGDHRLSRDEDLALLNATVAELLR
jgi:pimeloyl-ACP methyl ester carboxylesterase